MGVVFNGTPGVSSATINTTTVLGGLYSTNNVRGAVSDNWSNLWAFGATSGISYTTLGSSAGTALSTTFTNARDAGIFDGQLCASSGATGFRSTNLGSGLPTTSGQTATNLPGISSTTGSPYAFFFADLSSSVPGVDTLYVADDSATGLQKFSLVAGTWTANGSVVVSGNALRGLTGVVNGSGVTLYGATPTAFVSLTDSSGYNAALTGTFSSLATSGTNKAFRGIALTPNP